MADLLNLTPEGVQRYTEDGKDKAQEKKFICSKKIKERTINNVALSF